MIIRMTNLCLVQPCPAIGGDTCEFPFTYNETQHNGCITHDNDGTLWCDVGNEEKTNCEPTACPGSFLLILEKHVYCSGCRIMTNLYLVECKSIYHEPCVFPFNYHGADFYKCIIHKGTPFCDVGKGWQECMPDCEGNFVLPV